MVDKSPKQKDPGVALPLVIVNPRSAGGATKENWAAIASDLRTHFGAFRVEFTKAPGDGAVIAKENAEAGVTFIIACGGDGSIHEVANGILQSGKDVELGILPSGTGGDFRRSLEIPDDLREAAVSLKNGKTRTIDVGKITFQNFNDETESRFFLNITSFGLAAAIIARAKSSTSLDWVPIDAVRGPASYWFSMFKEIVELETTEVRVKIDDLKEKKMTTVNFCVANARYFGGGMMIAPMAKLSDGFLDVVNIGDIKTAKVILNAPSLYFGKHLSLSEVKTKIARRIEARPLDPTDDVRIEVDGELPGKLPAIYELVPKALKIRVPSS